MKYVVKFLSRNKKDQICTINPPFSLEEARRVVKDLKSMGMSAWLEEDEVQNYKR